MRSSPLSNTETARSSIPSERSRSDLLEGRDRRHVAFLRCLGAGAPALLSLSLNIPGAQKLPPGALPLFFRGHEQAFRDLPGAQELEFGVDILGPFALVSVEVEPAAAKAWAVRLEEEEPFGRLLDLDIHDRHGSPFDRAALGFPQRSCLICSAPARDCIRVGRHPMEAVLERVHELLRPFCD